MAQRALGFVDAVICTAKITITWVFLDRRLEGTMKGEPMAIFQRRLNLRGQGLSYDDERKSSEVMVHGNQEAGELNQASWGYTYSYWHSKVWVLKR